MKKIITIVSCLLCTVLFLASCILHEDGTTSRVDPVGSRFEILKTSDGTEVNVKRLCSINAGSGAGEVGCKKIPGEDYCPSNISFAENTDIFVTDCLGSKVERFSCDGKYISGVSLKMNGKPEAVLTYAVYSNGFIYAIFDQSAVCRFDMKGNGELIAENGNYLMLDVSQKDGRVIVFGWGTTQHITDDGKLEAEYDFKNVEYEPDPENYLRTASVRYNRDGMDKTYAVNTSYQVDYIGIMNDCLLIRDYDGEHNVYTAYDKDGAEKFSFYAVTDENVLAPARAALVYGNKLYVLTCSQEGAEIYEISAKTK